MDWDEDQRSGCSSGRSRSLERDTTRRQPFLWRMALDDDDDHGSVTFYYRLIDVDGAFRSVAQAVVNVTHNACRLSGTGVPLTPHRVIVRRRTK